MKHSCQEGQTPNSCV